MMYIETGEILNIALMGTERQSGKCGTHAAATVGINFKKTHMFLISLIKKQFMETSVDILAFKAQFVWLVHCYSFRRPNSFSRPLMR